MKAIVAIIVGLAALMAINATTGGTLVEGFWGNPTRTYKVSRTVGTSKGNMFSIPGTYQSILPPRFSNVDYGADIRYNMPSASNLGSPSDPLMFQSLVDNAERGVQADLVGGAHHYGCGSDYRSGNVTCGGACGCPGGPMPGTIQKPTGHKETGGEFGDVKEGYCTGCAGVVSCSKGGKMPPQSAHSVPATRQDNLMTPHYSDPSYHDAMADLKTSPVTSDLPVGDMTALNALGGVEQPVVYDRFLWANQKSKLYAQGDYIRGDLPIVPASTGWFRPSVHPHIDLNQGALSVMGGSDNTTQRVLHELQNAASGGVQNVFGGINYSDQKIGQHEAARNDVTVTAFP